MKAKHQSWMIPAFALSFLAFSKMSHGYNAYDWVDACDVTDPKILSLLESEVALIQVGDNPGQIRLRADGNYQIETIPFTYVDCMSGPPCQTPIDPSTMFYGQPRAIGRSGVLIGPDLILTAPHVEPFPYYSYKVVFGLHSKKINGICQQPDWGNIPSSNVFSPNTLKPTINTYPGSDGNIDYFAFYLDRPTARPFLRMRRSGSAYPGNRAVEINHPMRLSAKVTTNAEFFGNGYDGGYYGVLTGC